VQASLGRENSRIEVKSQKEKGKKQGKREKGKGKKRVVNRGSWHKGKFVVCEA
jgi:hypothetical protein